MTTATKTTKKTKAPADPRAAAVNKLAALYLGIETLEARGRDCLDFHDLSVTSVRRALEEAYEAGRRASA